MTGLIKGVTTIKVIEYDRIQKNSKEKGADALRKEVNYKDGLIILKRY